MAVKKCVYVLRIVPSREASYAQRLVEKTSQLLIPDFSQSLKKEGSKTAKMYIAQQLQQCKV
jgi:hypothetical protein